MRASLVLAPWLRTPGAAPTEASYSCVNFLLPAIALILYIYLPCVFEDASLLKAGFCHPLSVTFALGLATHLSLYSMFLSVLTMLMVQVPQPTCKAADVCWLILAGQATKLDCLPGSFSPPEVTPAVLGVVVSVGTGCAMPIPQAVEGAIALVERGGCSFGQKALNVQKSGAVGAVIWDNTEAPLLLLQAPGTVHSKTTGKFSVHDDKKVSGEVTIPVVSLVKAEGERLIQLAANEGSEMFVSIEYDPKSCEGPKAEPSAAQAAQAAAQAAQAKRRAAPSEDQEDEEARTRLRLENLIIGDSIVTKVSADYFEAEVVRMHY
jgi:hypothetical protein